MKIFYGYKGSFAAFTRTLALLSGCLSVGHTMLSSAKAADFVTPPASYPPTLWQGKGTAVLRILRRVDSHVEVMTIPVGQDGRYKTLRIHVTQCVERPATLASDTAIHVILQDDSNPDFDFDGWVLRSEPALSTYANPLYGISVVRCEGNVAPPLLGPMPPVGKPDPDLAQNPGKAPESDHVSSGATGAHILPTPPPQQEGPQPLDDASGAGQTLQTPAPAAPQPEKYDTPMQLAPP